MLHNPYRRLLLLSGLILLVAYTAHAQPKREFRGVWVATVANIDFPSDRLLDARSQQQEWTDMLDRFQAAGLNAVIAQIRPAADAFYPSELVPWSVYLTGRQGAPPVPSYDPLQFMIEETHKRGMTFHAWLNPYRATMGLDTSSLARNHVVRAHPEWVVPYGGRYYLNPGLPEVRTHIRAVVEEVVRRYEIDAIHFDDYFYPYKVKNEVFPDQAAFAEYGSSFEDIQSWRRHNVDELIRELAAMIEQQKPWVLFGISPFGVWRNASTDPVNGSNSRASIESYDDLNADVLKWLELGWIDYIMPQLYWYIGLPVADHKALLAWWEEHTYGQQLLIGHAAYKVGDPDKLQWQNPDEIPAQIRLNRASSRAQGSAFFSARSLAANKLAVNDSIAAQYPQPALNPVTTQYVERVQHFPHLERPRNVRTGGVRLRWKYNKRDLEHPPLYYAIYRYDGRQVGDFDGAHLVGVSAFNRQRREWEWVDASAEPGKRYTYVVRPVNRTHHEGQPSKARRIRVR